jgi:hypothetical protein
VRHRAEVPAETKDVGREAVLSTIVALAVVVTAYLSWHADVVAQRPVDVLGLVIHSVLAGIVALLVATWVALRIEP